MCNTYISVCESHVSEGIVGDVYWAEKGHMVPEAMRGQRVTASVMESLLSHTAEQ